jgi:hypothetical protein
MDKDWTIESLIWPTASAQQNVAHPGSPPATEWSGDPLQWLAARVRTGRGHRARSRHGGAAGGGGSAAYQQQGGQHGQKGSRGERRAMWGGNLGKNQWRSTVATEIDGRWCPGGSSCSSWGQVGWWGVKESEGKMTGGGAHW